MRNRGSMKREVSSAYRASTSLSPGWPEDSPPAVGAPAPLLRSGRASEAHALLSIVVHGVVGAQEDVAQDPQRAQRLCGGAHKGREGHSAC